MIYLVQIIKELFIEIIKILKCTYFKYKVPWVLPNITSSQSKQKPIPHPRKFSWAPTEVYTGFQQLNQSLTRGLIPPLPWGLGQA